jgi:hypothetical protein
MFVRVKSSGRKDQQHPYLQIVHNYREQGKVRQKVIATLGRRDELVGSGQLDGLIRSLSTFSEKLRVAEAAAQPDLRARAARAWGPALVFGRLWEQQGLPAIVETLATGRRYRFDVERAVFALALQRLCAPGSDLQGAGWVRRVEGAGLAALELQHLYRANAFLHDVREELERRLFVRDRDLFRQELDLVLVDTTSLYVYGDEETAWRRRGYSRDRRGDLPQYVLCVAVDRQGWPVTWEVLPGHTADGDAFGQTVTKLRERFRVGQVVMVGDRGMMSAERIEQLAGDGEAPYGYVLGCRMRRQKEVTEAVLARGGRYRPVADNLEVKEVRVGPRRYVVCRNPQEARRDAAERAAIVDRLTEVLARQGAKSLVKNRGYARFLKVVKGGVTLDPAAVEQDARLDGKFVLTTNQAWPAEEVALAYKSLWRVERTFREAKTGLEIRPIFHQRDDASIGHIVAGFLALRLEVDLQRRLEERQVAVPWADLMADLAQVQAVDIDLDGQRYRCRTDLAGQSHHAFAAAGVRPPSHVTHLGPSPPLEDLPENAEM